MAFYSSSCCFVTPWAMGEVLAGTKGSSEVFFHLPCRVPLESN